MLALSGVSGASTPSEPDRAEHVKDVVQELSSKDPALYRESVNRLLAELRQIGGTEAECAGLEAIGLYGILHTESPESVDASYEYLLRAVKQCPEVNSVMYRVSQMALRKPRLCEDLQIDWLMSMSQDDYLWRVARARTLLACGHDNKLRTDVTWLARFLSAEMFGKRASELEWYVDSAMMGCLAESVDLHDLAATHLGLAIENLCRAKLVYQEISDSLVVESQLPALGGFWISPPAMLDRLSYNAAVVDRLDAETQRCVLALVQETVPALEHLGGADQEAMKVALERLVDRLTEAIDEQSDGSRPN